MCRTTNPGGGGSSPPVRANSSGCRGAWPSLPALEAGDRWFESTHPDQFDEQSCFKSNLLQVFVLMHDLIRKVCNFSGSCISSVGRAPLSESGCPRFKSATGCQSTRCPSGQGALCKSADAGSIPALVSKLQWLERRGTDLLNRQMLVRIQSGAPLSLGAKAAPYYLMRRDSMRTIKSRRTYELRCAEIKRPGSAPHSRAQ